MKLSILITLLNEELVLAQTHAAISAQLEDMLGKDLSDYEILYIDDGSNDRTFELIEGIARDNDRVKYIRFSRNFGRESGWLVLSMRREMRSWSWMVICNIRPILSRSF